MRLRIRRGLDVRIPGAPRQEIDEGPSVSTVAVLPADHRLRRPAALVAVGERVRLGQPLVTDRRADGVVLTSPGSGVVTGIDRDERREPRAVVITLAGDDEEPLATVPAARVPALSRAEVVELLVAGGLWPALRERPFHRVPAPGAPPDALFVTVTDTDPLAARPDVVIACDAGAFALGVTALAHLTDGPIFVCRAAGASIPAPDVARLTAVDVSGPHPAGLVGTHVHQLFPVLAGRRVWHVGYQDALAFGRQLLTGRRSTERVLAIGGPAVRDPRLVRTRLGACIDDLVRGALHEGPSRLISGSVLAGRQASGWGRHLGRHHLQVCAVPEAEDESAVPGLPWTTARHGSPGPMIPTEDFERVLPLDLLPTPLLRALVVGDDEAARDLGCLELDEEDLALCTYVCPGKQEYGPLLTRALERIEAAG